MIPLQSCLPTIEGSAHGSGFLTRGKRLMLCLKALDECPGLEITYFLVRAGLFKLIGSS